MIDSWPWAKIHALLESNGVPKENSISIVQTGSAAYGTSVDTSDFDATIVRMPSFPEAIFGSAWTLTMGTTERDMKPAMSVRTAGDPHTRSTEDDIDAQVYTLLHFAKLARKGNPNVLEVLWSPFAVDHPTFRFREELRELVPSKLHATAFVGYIDQQMKKWRETGRAGQGRISRPELVEKYGYDTKFAGHIVRLAHEGIEYLSTGTLTIPLEYHVRTLVVDVRTGIYSEEDAIKLGETLTEELKEAKQKSPLPEQYMSPQAFEDFAIGKYREWFEVTRD